jgi:ABC-type transport system involved in multi-copper enzyme maturation permease subunit
MKVEKLYNLSSDISRSVKSKGFIFGCLGIFFIITFASIEDFLSEIIRHPHPPEPGFHLQIIINALKSEAFLMSFPIICALPYTTAFVDDIKNGFIKQYLSRTTRKQYITGKLIACGFSGGLVLLAGIVMTLLISAVIFAPMEGIAPELPEGAASIFNQAPIAPRMEIDVEFFDIAVQAYIYFFSGIFWSLVGFAFAALTSNRYIAYVSPFIFYYVLIILYERYLPTMHAIYPKDWYLIEPLVLTVALGYWFMLFAKRRLNHV